MKKTWIVPAIALFAVVTSVLPAGGNKEDEAADTETSAAGTEDMTQISTENAVAIVNGEAITRDEFDSIIESNIYRYEYQSGQEFAEEQRPLLERQVLDGLIMRTVLQQEATGLGLSVSDADVEETFTRFRSQFPSDAAYEIALEEEGFTEEEFRRELYRQMLIEQLIRTQVYDDITVSEEDLRAFYDDNPSYFEQAEQVAARHIILVLNGDESDSVVAERRAELDAIRSEIVAGTDFGEAAAEYSEGPSASRGGDLGSFGRGEMVPEFEDVAFSLPIGEVSEVFRSSFGFHILQVTGRTEAATAPYEEVRQSIEAYLLEDARNRGAREYVSALRADADVEELIELDGTVPTP